MPEAKKVVKGTGLPRNTVAALTYILGWISGLLFLFIEKDEFVRFHAAQSIVVFGLLTVLSMVPVIGWTLTPVILLVGLALWLILIVKAYQGQKFILPYVGGWAEKLLGKIK